MKYEEVKLRPADGAIDRESIASWFAEKDYAFVDPREPTLWHMCLDEADAEQRHTELLADPPRFPHYATVGLSADYVWVSAYFAGICEFRALEFIQWLIRDREWLVAKDWSDYAPMDDPQTWFRDGVGEPDYIYRDRAGGVLHTWEVSRREVIVHSIGQFVAYNKDPDEKWRNCSSWKGYLSASALAEWNAAVAIACGTGHLDDVLAPDTSTGTFSIEDADRLQRAYFDEADIPESLRPLAAIVERMYAQLARWSTGQSSVDIVRAWDND